MCHCLPVGAASEKVFCRSFVSSADISQPYCPLIAFLSSFHLCFFCRSFFAVGIAHPYWPTMLYSSSELYPEPKTISFGILQCQLFQNCDNCRFPSMQQLQSCVPFNSNEAKKLMSNSGWNLNPLICDICHSIRASSKRSFRNKIEVVQLLKLNLIPW